MGNPAVIAFAAQQLWKYGWVLTLFTHNPWFATGLVFTILYGTLFGSDFSQVPLDTAVVYHHGMSLAVIPGAFLALLFVYWLRLPKLVSTEYFGSNTSWGRELSLTLMLMTGLFFIGGMQFVMQRYTSFPEGMSPLGPAYVDASTSTVVGIILLVLAGVALIATIWYSIVHDNWTRLQLKYMLLLAFFVWTSVVHDALANDDPPIVLASPWPEIIEGVLILVVHGLAYLYWYFVPASFGYLSGDARRNLLALDPLYRNPRNGVRFLLSIGLPWVLVHIGSLLANYFSGSNFVIVLATQACVSLGIACAILIYRWWIARRPDIWEMTVRGVAIPSDVYGKDDGSYTQLEAASETTEEMARQFGGSNTQQRSAFDRGNTNSRGTRSSRK